MIALRQDIKCYYKASLSMPIEMKGFKKLVKGAFQVSEAAATAAMTSTRAVKVAVAAKLEFVSRPVAVISGTHRMGSKPGRPRSFASLLRQAANKPSMKVLPRSRNSRLQAVARALRPQWEKLGKRCQRPCPARRIAMGSFPVKSTIWMVRQKAPMENKLSGPVFNLRFTRTYDPYQELPEFALEEIMAAAQLVLMSRDRRRRCGRA